MSYTAGWNMPGYLPESEPAEFDTFEEARDYIVEELQNYADSLDEDQEEEALDVEDAAEEAQGKRRPFNVYAGDYVYWVAKE